MKYLLLSLLILSSISFAADKTNPPASSKNNKMSELGTIDAKTLDMEPGEKTKGVAEETALYANPGKIKVKFACKSHVDGHELKQGEPGYDECLQKVKNEKHDSKAPGADIKVKFDE